MNKDMVIKHYVHKYEKFSKKEKNNKLIIMVGVPGSGKTTTAKALENSGMARIATDDLKSFYPDRKYVLTELFSLQYNILEKLMNLNIDVIADSNSDKQIYRNGLIELAKKYGYSYKVIYCYAKKETIYNRMEARKNFEHFYVDKDGIDQFFREMEVPTEDAIFINSDNSMKCMYDNIKILLS